MFIRKKLSNINRNPSHEKGSQKCCQSQKIVSMLPTEDKTLNEIVLKPSVVKKEHVGAVQMEEKTPPNSWKMLLRG